ARERIQQALRLDADLVPARMLMSALEAAEGRRSEAEGHLLYVLDRRPTHSAAAMALAQLRAASNDLSGARDVLRPAARADDAQAEVLLALGDLERQLGDPDAA